MKEILSRKLYQYLRDNNPDFLLELRERNGLIGYLSDQLDLVISLLDQPDTALPVYLLEEVCMDILTTDLKPSKYNYIQAILEDAFLTDYRQWSASGKLRFEVINLVTHCQPLFESAGFSQQNEEDRQLRYNITGTIDAYLQKQL